VRVIAPGVCNRVLAASGSTAASMRLSEQQ
jgi:hypothetical protein